MGNQFIVEVDHEALSEFRETLVTAMQNAEALVIELESVDYDQARIKQLQYIIGELSISSAKLFLTPISESLEDSLKMLDRLLEIQCFPVAMGEFLLLLLDKIQYLALEVEKTRVIDIAQSQNVLVSLQFILQAKTPNELNTAVDHATKTITYNLIQDNGVEACDSIDLFDDSEKDEEQTAVVDILQAPAINHTEDPLAHANEVISQVMQDHSLNLLVQIADKATSHGESHTNFVLLIGLSINRLMGSPIEEVELAQGLCLHDIALSAIPETINKTERLTEAEIERIRQHPALGAELARSMRLPETSIQVIEHHHERMDGNGYPFGLAGSQISDAGKLTAIIDSFHAMIEQRPHKKYTRSLLRAVVEINNCTGNWYDKTWVKHFNLFMRNHWLSFQQVRK
jgi:HD-GYP domain-containing protein (c-di-GMP phosphodiesterase class II)